MKTQEKIVNREEFATPRGRHSTALPENIYYINELISSLGFDLVFFLTGLSYGFMYGFNRNWNSFFDYMFSSIFTFIIAFVFIQIRYRKKLK